MMGRMFTMMVTTIQVMVDDQADCHDHGQFENGRIAREQSGTHDYNHNGLDGEFEDHAGE